MASRAEVPEAAARQPAVRGARAVPGIVDVAAQAGVSTATVSRALRGVDRVSPATRDRVLAAAALLNYVASPTAASLASGRTGVVAVLAPFLSRWFFAKVLDGVESRLRDEGLHVLLFNVGTTRSSRSLLLDRRLLRRRVDAVLAVSCDLEPPEVALVAALNVPVVTVGVDAGGWDLVGIDDVRAGHDAMAHLLALGHRDVAYIGGDRVRDVHVATAVSRLEGAQKAAAEVGAPAPPEHVGDWTVVGGLAVGQELLGRPDRPTAVFAASDEMAIGVVLAARRLGLRVPEDLSVIGVDDHELAFTHELTTVRQPVDELGTSAAGLLVDHLRTPRPDEHRTVVTLPTELVLRGSTAPPSSSAGAQR